MRGSARREAGDLDALEEHDIASRSPSSETRARDRGDGGRGILLLALALASAAAGLLHACRPPPAGRPNVLFLVVDDLRPELGCYGVDHVRSPNIDRLARRGVVFGRAYCQQAICSPSRTSLMTGLRPDSSGVIDQETHFREKNPEVVTLTQHFRSHGYRAVGLGKIFHYREELQDPPSWSVPWRRAEGANWVLPGNTAFIARREETAREQGLEGHWATLAALGPPTERADVPDQAYPDGRLTRMAVEALRDLEGGEEPFFLAVGWVKPHLPFCAPARYWELYDPERIPLADRPGPPRGAFPFSMNSWLELRNYEGMPEGGPVSAERARELVHGYLACISYVDAQVGRLLDELEGLGLLEDTIVVLWGDHGYKLGDYGAWCKNTDFEVDTRVPLILSAPRARARGEVSSALVELVDVYPTLCELAGLPPPDHIEGTSLTALLDEPDRPWKTACFSQILRTDAVAGKTVRVVGNSMRTDRYRLTIWRELDISGRVIARELYDHEVDPGETRNVVRDEGNRGLVRQLRSKLEAGWRQAGPPGP